MIHNVGPVETLPALVMFVGFRRWVSSIKLIE
jgi:hypothetical protein